MKKFIKWGQQPAPVSWSWISLGLLTMTMILGTLNVAIYCSMRYIGLGIFFAVLVVVSALLSKIVYQDIKNKANKKEEK